MAGSIPSLKDTLPAEGPDSQKDYEDAIAAAVEAQSGEMLAMVALGWVADDTVAIQPPEPESERAADTAQWFVPTKVPGMG